MIIGQRIRTLREGKNLSQEDIETRTGLLRCYTSRVENGYTVPSLETIERFAHGLEIPLYQIFYDGEKPPKMVRLSDDESPEEDLWGATGRDAKALLKLRRALGQMISEDRKLLVFIAEKMARRVGK